MEQSRYKVLLIEDDKLDQMAFKRAVEQQQLPYDFEIAGSVSEARSKLDCGLFDVVISDYRLGDGTAFDILGIVKNTPTIVVTGAGGEEVAVQAWRAGAYDYLLKDMDRGYLKALPITVENAMHNKQMEDKLRLLSGAVTSTDDSVYIADMDGKIIFVNKAFCKTYGYKEEDILGKESNVLWIEKWQSIGTRSVFQTQVGESAWTVGFYQKRQDGSIFPVSLSRSIIKDSKGNDVAMVTMARDITERILVEDELRQANRQLQQHSQLNAELAIIVSDTLKEVLTEKDAAGAPEDIGRRIEMANRIIGNFLDISQIAAGKMKLERSEVDLCSVILDVQRTMLPLAEKKGVQLSVLMPESEFIISADHDKLMQAVARVISYSIESTADNGHVEVRMKGLSDKITIEIEDDGPCINASKLNQIFDLFEQIKVHLHHKDQKLSLDLPIAKKLVELHGGKVSVKPAPGEPRGNTFSISLPKPSVRQQTVLAAGKIEV